jgi:hypothetical protein
MAIDNVDFTGEVRAQAENLFRTDPAALCQVGVDILEEGFENVAKNAAKQLEVAITSTVNATIQGLANELDFSKRFNVCIGDFQLNLTARIALGQTVLDAMGGGKIPNEGNLDTAKLKGVLSSLNPANMGSAVKKLALKDKIKTVTDTIGESFLEGKQQLAEAGKNFSANGLNNAKKFASLQGVCDSVAVGSIELGLKTQVAKYLNSTIPDLGNDELKFLSDVLVGDC